MTTPDYTRTMRALPPKDVPLEWIAPSGQVVRGRFLGGAVWRPDGSPMYVYYLPEFWRLTHPVAGDPG